MNKYVYFWKFLYYVSQTQPVSRLREYSCNEFFIAWHWSITIPSRALWYIQCHQHSNSQTKVLVSSKDSSPHPKRIDCLWWLTPRKGAKGMSYLFVRYVVSNDATSPKYCHAARLLASAQKIFLMRFCLSMSISMKK